MLSLASVYGFEPPRPYAASLLPVIIIFSLHGGFLSGLLSTLLAGLYILFPYHQTQILEQFPRGFTGLFLLLFNGVLISFAGRKLMTAPAPPKKQPSIESILDRFPCGMAIASLEGRFLQGNRAVLALLGIEEHELLNLSLDDVAQSDNGSNVKNHLHRLLNGMESIRYEGCCLHKTGFPVWLRVMLTLERDNFGAPHYLLVQFDDISLPTLDNGQRASPVAEMLENRQMRHAILDHIPEMIGFWNKDCFNIFGNKALEEWCGLSPAQMPGKHIREILGDEQYWLDKPFIEEVLLGRPQSFERAMTDFSGKECFKEIKYIPNKAKEGVEGFYVLITDTTDVKKNEELIWLQTNYDNLTKLPNRRLFMDRLGQEILKAERTGRFIALLYIDIDRFREINDSLGHSAGDAMLIEIASRLGSCLRSCDMVSRLGGDEFMVVLANLDNPDHVERVAEKLLSALREPLEIENELFFISASIGVTFYPNDAKTLEALVKNADQAMSVSKNSGRNRFSYFTRSMRDKALARLKLVSDLRVAVDERQFILLFQPIVDPRTGGIYKAEALVRWRHPVRGVVSPADFIPLAEETGLILQLGDWVFREAANFAKQMTTITGKPFQVSVNGSPVQFHEKHKNEDWSLYLKEIGLNSKQMVVEITEGLLLDTDAHVRNLLLEYRDAGIEVAIGDFGAGYSSLAGLHKLDIDYLKIDQSFTRHLQPGSTEMAISEAIIVMAHKLGLKVIAAGVETDLQRDLLTGAGCDYLQGYLYSKPVSAADFRALLLGNAMTEGVVSV